jgi:iron complex outermembrane receptor protein
MGFAMAPPAFAQDTAATHGATALEEVVVTARRKEESLQDVPTTINAVTGADIQKLNFRDFKEIASVVPGLTMNSNANGIGAAATVRGVAYEVNASGNNGTVEFYLNDAPISAGNLFQAVYDIQQVELLRGPQGTLRGRASPSGSMTVTTRRPDLNEMGGYGSATATDIGGTNVQGAFGIPLVDDKLAVRVAALYEKNEANRVKSLNNPTDPEAESKSARVTLRYEPLDSLAFTLTYQNTKQDIVSFDQVESQQEVNPNAPVPATFVAGYVPPYIRASDRRSVEDRPRLANQEFKNYNFQAQWAVLGQRLNYVGARNEQQFFSYEPNDIGNYFAPGSAAAFNDIAQVSHVNATATAHELRLSSEERIAGIFDYSAGGFYQKASSPTDLTSPTPLTGTGTVLNSPASRRGSNLEKSVFANVTAHLFDALELSGGIRHIKYEAQGRLILGGVDLASQREDSNFSTDIYSATAKYNFNDDLMAYTSFGTSWRPGVFVVGDRNPTLSPLERKFLQLPPEKSKSVEVGLKASALDKRLRTALSVYYQDFDNFVYRSGSGVYFIDSTRAAPSVGRPFNFVSAVPATVKGAELDASFAATSDWDVGVIGSYTDGKIKNGFVPCNDYSPRDGVPDATTTAPSLATIQATGEVISGCTVNYRASVSPPWSGTLHSEYRFPITSRINGYARGLLSMYGDSKNDPANRVDDYNAYELLNLYLGVRDPDGAWEVSLYGKNVTDKEVVLQRSSAVLTASPNGALVQSNYYGGSSTAGMVMTAPREFGLTVNYAFGSK